MAAGVALLAGASAAALLWLGRDARPSPDPAAASPAQPGGQPIAAEQIATGRLAMERLPIEVGAALEAHTGEIVRNAEAIATKQARVSGVCAPGSAIRVIGEDGSVRCQRLPRGVASVTALAGVPRLSVTGTGQGSVAGGVGRFQTSGEDDFLVVPVILPDGALVTGFGYVFYDADPEVDGAAYLYRSDDQLLAGVTTGGAANEVRSVATGQVQLPRVDAGKYAYFVYFQMSTRAGLNLMPISASVSYHLP
jgi:hypothetical protein